MSKKDDLFGLFQHHLFNAIVEDEKADSVIERVVSDYLNLLKSQGMIAAEHLEDITFDLREEVTDMYRKKTYGHQTLAQYRAGKAGKSSRR